MVSDVDKKGAKQQFQLFDKILSIQNVFTKKPSSYLAAANDPVKRQELRQRTKKHGEIAGGIAKQFMSDIIQRDDEIQKLDALLDVKVKQIVQETTNQLAGDKHLEKALKQSLAPENRAL